MKWERESEKEREAKHKTCKEDAIMITNKIIIYKKIKTRNRNLEISNPRIWMASTENLSYGDSTKYQGRTQMAVKLCSQN